MLDAAVRRVPITGDIEHVTAPEGATIAEFVAIAFPAEAHRSHVIAIIDGEEIAREAWERAPRAGETLQLVFRPGGKDFFRTLLQIAVIAVSVWVGGGALGGWFAAGTWQAAVAAAGVSILGNLAINSLIPIPKPDGFPAPTPYYSLSSARNSARLWSAVPMLFGRHRIVPPRMSDPVQEVIGGVTYLRVALCLGLCPMQVSDWKIGETALSSFAGVEMEVRLNADDPPHTLITGDPVQDAVGATLTHTAWTERTTATDVDEIEVIYDFPSGLGGLDSKGRKTARTVNLRLQYRPAGSSEDWTDWRPTVPQANEASAGAGVPYRPEYFTTEGDLIAWRGQLGGMSGVAGDIVPITRSDPGRAFRHSERFAVPRGQYDVRTQRVEAASTDPNIVDAVSWGVLGSIRTAADPFPNRKLATACFRIKASDQLSNMVDTLNCIAESLQPVFSAEALADPTIADAGEFTDVETSSNPAVLALLAMRGPNTAYPKPDEEVDWPSFAAGAAKFTARGLTFNEYVESDIGRWEMVNRILAAGHARAVKHNGRVSLVIDDSKAGQPPAQTFTPRNVLNFRWQKTFPRLPHAIRTPFANADNGWQADEVTVYLPNPAGGTYTAETATRYETVAMPGKTDADEIRTVVNQYARNSYFQTESFEFETDVEHLTVKRGDYCVVQHHAMATGLGAARIATREVNGGGDVTAIVLDADIETPMGESLAVQWRTIVVESGFARMEVIGEQAVTRDAANPRRFVFGSPQSGSTKPVARGDTYEGDIALVGIAGKVSFEVLIRDIQPRPHLRAGISCVAYAGERFVDAPDWPAHDPKVTRPYAARPTAPTNAVPIASTLQIAVGFTQPAMPIGVELTGYRVARRESGSTGDSWEPLGPLGRDERIAIAPAGEPGADYDIRIIAVGVRDDGVTVYSDALIAAAVSAVTAPAAPSGCGGAFSTRTSSGGAQQLVLTATWTANENPDVLDTVVEQRVSTGPDVWQEIGRGAAATGRTEIHGLPVGRAYVLGFTNISKRGAPSTRTTISSITAPDTLVATGALAAVPGSALAAAIAAAGASADADAAAAAASAAAAAAAQALAEAARDTATSAAGSAGTYSGEAQDARDDAVAAAAVAGTHADTADGHAATALAQASSATASAAAASNSATLSATFAAGSQGTINSSATFADNANATGVPTNWESWDGGTMTRVTGIAPQPYAIQIDAGAGAHGGIKQTLNGRVAPGWHVLEVDVTLLSGTLNGAGVYMHWGPTGGIAYSDSTSFVAGPDITGLGPGTGTTNKLYKFRKLVNIITASDLFQMFVMSHWEGFGQSIASANSLKFHRAALRPASQAEIEARQAKTDLVTTNANVSANTLAISTESAARVLSDNVLTARFVANQKNSQNMLRDSTFRATDRWALNNGAVGQQIYLDHTYLWMPFGAHRSAYQDVRVEPGNRYAISGDVYSDNDNEVRLYVLWLNEARDTAMGANSGYDGLFGNAGGASHPGWRHVTFDINNANANGGYGLIPPAGTAWARVFSDNWPGDGTAGGAAARRLKFERGDYASAWSEDDGYLEALDVGADLAIANAEIATNAAASASNAASIASLTTTVSSNHTAVMAPSVNLIPYPSGTARTNPTGEGLSTTQQGWTVSGGSAGGGFVNGYWDPAGGAILYNMWAAGYSSGSDRYYYIDIPVTYWGWYTFAFDGYVSNLDATKVSYYVQALNGSNTWLGESATTAFSASPNGRRSVTFNAPSGTEKLRVAFRIQAHTSPSAGAYADLVMRALQLEHGQVATKFNEAGRIIAGERRIGLAEAEISVTAATLATESAARALLETNLRAALGAGSDNLVINTDFYNGLEGWVTGWDGNSGLPVTRGFADTDAVGGSAAAYSGAVRTAYVRLTGTPAANTVVDGYTTRQWANLADLKRWAVRVPGAVRVHASMYMSAHRGKARLIVGEFDAAGTLITDANAWDGTANHNNFGSGNPANAERVGGFFTTNANTRYLVLIPRLVGVSGGNDPYLFYGWAMVAMASAQQTVPAPYVSGGLDRGIYGDVALNAGAIADVNGGAAWLEAVVSASGGDLGAFRLRAGKAGSFIELISTVLRLANVSNGAVIEVMRAIGGFAFFSNPVSIDVGGKRMTLGPGFGASSDLLFWFGPDTTAISAMTKTNGHWAWATDGETYKGTGALVDSTVNEQTKTGTAAFDNVTTSGITVHTMATIDLTVGASGYLELLSPLFFGPLSINQESGMTLSAGTDWFGQMIITEQLQSGGSEYTLWTIPLQISDTGGGLFDFIFDPPVNKVVAQNVSGASRYRFKLQRTSGSNNVSGNGLQGKFTIRRTP